MITKAAVLYRRERWATPDGDFVDMDFVDGQPGQPFVVMFHGLEGSSNSHYARNLMAHLKSLGWGGAVANFRSCSGEMNHAPRFYHSGDAEEIFWILRRMKDTTAAAGYSRFNAVGISLGGNAMLRWLGEYGSAACFVDGACAISAPLCLHGGAEAISSGFSRIYSRMFLQSMKAKCMKKLEQYPNLFDREALNRACSLQEFDNIVTAPLHGFRDADDYWNHASSKHVLNDIKVPTLILNAQNDPFLAPHHLPKSASPDVTLEYPRQGGHIGFITGPPPGRTDWIPKRIVSFLNGINP